MLGNIIPIWWVVENLAIKNKTHGNSLRKKIWSSKIVGTCKMSHYSQRMEG
jgi:hypothetical protein